MKSVQFVADMHGESCMHGCQIRSHRLHNNAGYVARGCGLHT